MLDYDFDQIARANGSKNCPNCGAPIETEKCPYCGTVFVDFAAMDADQPFYMTVKKGGKVYILKVKMSSMVIKTEPNVVYDPLESTSLYIMPSTSSLTLDFDILDLD